MEAVFPKQIDNDYKGSRIAAYVFLLLAMVGTLRSCIHIFAPDGGAGSIAGMDLTVAGANNIIFSFALWGSNQLLVAIIQLVVFFRYKRLIPMMYLLLALEIALRMLVGQLKPPTFAHVPPGQIGNYIVLPLSLLMFYLSINTAKPKS
jgi:hypothetical protein